MIKNFYAVRKGRENHVVVNSWAKCLKLVSRYSGAIFKGFKEKEDAIKFANIPFEAPKPKLSTSKKLGVLRNYNIDMTGTGRCELRGKFRGKNRCLKRYFSTTTGNQYKPVDSGSIPWDLHNYAE